MEAGLPPGGLNVLPCNNTVAEQLVVDPRVITSYSIHYTKLYDGVGPELRVCVMVFEASRRNLAVPGPPMVDIVPASCSLVPSSVACTTQKSVPA